MNVFWDITQIYWPNYSRIYSFHRAYLKSNCNIEDALAKSEDLLRNTKRANIDQIVICLDLLANVYNKKHECANETKCLTSLIPLNHGLLPDIWVRLGESYMSLNANSKEDKNEVPNRLFPIFSCKPHHVICCCFLRAYVLLKTVETTVSSYSSKSNAKLQCYLENKVSTISSTNNISNSELSVIKTEMTIDVFNRYSNSDAVTGKV